MNRLRLGGLSSVIIILVLLIRVCSALTSSSNSSFTSNDEAWAELQRETSVASEALKTAVANGDQRGVQAAEFELIAYCSRRSLLKASTTVFEDMVRHDCSQLDTVQASPTPSAGMAIATGTPSARLL